MKDEIYSAFKAKKYKTVTIVFESFSASEHVKDVFVAVAHSYRILGEFEKAINVYYRAVHSNKSDKRSSFHALYLIINNDLDNEFGFYFADSLIDCQGLSFEETVLLLKFCCLKGYRVSRVNDVIANRSDRYEILYNTFSNFNGNLLQLKSLYYSDFVNDLNYCCLVDGGAQREAVYCVLLLDLFLVDGLSFDDVITILKEFMEDSLNVVEEVVLLSLLKNFYSLNILDLEGFFSTLNPSLIYPVIYSSFSNGKVSSEKFKSLVSFVKSNIQWQSIAYASEKSILDNRIAIVVPAFLNSNSSYVKFIRDYVLSIKKVNHAAEIKIFVTDELNLDINHLKFGYKSSQEFRNRHKEIFNQEGLELFEKSVDIWYSNGPNSATYLEDFIASIYEFSPSCTLSFSAYGSLFFSDFLYKNYPFIFIQTNVKDNPNYEADLYLTFYEDVSSVSRGKRFESRWFHQKSPYVELGSKKRLNKLDYLNYEYQFVMVTVGARLSKELTNDFSCRILDFISENGVQGKSICWLIIGDFERQELISLAKARNVECNLVFKNYESSLASAYSVCDIYLNPERTGGGISIAYAISAGIPAMCFFGADASPFVGEGMLFSSIEKYIGKLEYFLEHTDKLNDAHLLQLNKLQDNHSLTAVGTSLVKYIEDAAFSFDSRISGDI